MCVGVALHSRHVEERLVHCLQVRDVDEREPAEVGRGGPRVPLAQLRLLAVHLSSVSISVDACDRDGDGDEEATVVTYIEVRVLDFPDLLPALKVACGAR